jgi:hypothetical protein
MRATHENSRRKFSPAVFMGRPDKPDDDDEVVSKPF